MTQICFKTFKYRKEIFLGILQAKKGTRKRSIVWMCVKHYEENIEQYRLEKDSRGMKASLNILLKRPFWEGDLDLFGNKCLKNNKRYYKTTIW